MPLINESASYPEKFMGAERPRLHGKLCTIFRWYSSRMGVVIQASGVLLYFPRRRMEDLVCEPSRFERYLERMEGEWICK